MVAREVGGDVAPGAVRFGKAVEEDDGRMRRIAADRDVEVDAGGKSEALQLGHVSLPRGAPDLAGGRYGLHR